MFYRTIRPIVSLTLLTLFLTAGSTVSATTDSKSHSVHRKTIQHASGTTLSFHYYTKDGRRIQHGPEILRNKNNQVLMKNSYTHGELEKFRSYRSNGTLAFKEIRQPDLRIVIEPGKNLLQKTIYMPGKGSLTYEYYRRGDQEIQHGKEILRDGKGNILMRTNYKRGELTSITVPDTRKERLAVAGHQSPR